jgi:hypothetical protein
MAVCPNVDDLLQFYDYSFVLTQLTGLALKFTYADIRPKMFSSHGGVFTLHCSTYGAGIAQSV